MTVLKLAAFFEEMMSISKVETGDGDGEDRLRIGHSE